MIGPPPLIPNTSNAVSHKETLMGLGVWNMIRNCCASGILGGARFPSSTVVSAAFGCS